MADKMKKKENKGASTREVAGDMPLTNCDEIIKEIVRILNLNKNEKFLRLALFRVRNLNRVLRKK